MDGHETCNKRKLEESSLFISLAEERLGEVVVLMNISQEKRWEEELLKGRSWSLGLHINVNGSIESGLQNKKKASCL